VQREIAAEREALRRDVPFPQFAAAVAEKLAHRPQRSFVTRWAPLAAAAGLALIAGSALILRPSDTERQRSKGAASRSSSSRTRPACASSARATRSPRARGSSLSLKPEGRKQAAVLLIETGETSVIYAGPAVKGPLPESFVWTGKGVATLLVVAVRFEGGPRFHPLRRRRAPAAPTRLV